MCLFKVTQRVSLASNPRPLWQVRQKPEKAKTQSIGPALEVGPWAHIPLGRGTSGAEVSLELCL